jgi:hypothetical protein
MGDEMTDQDEPTTEGERAEDHNGDDEDRWGEPVEARGPDQLSVMVSARFSRAEADQLTAAAEAAGLSRSSLVRQAALSSITGKVLDIARVRRDMDEAERRLAAARQALG